MMAAMDPMARRIERTRDAERRMGQKRVHLGLGVAANHAARTLTG